MIQFAVGPKEKLVWMKYVEKDTAVWPAALHRQPAAGTELLLHASVSKLVCASLF